MSKTTLSKSDGKYRIVKRRQRSATKTHGSLCVTMKTCMVFIFCAARCQGDTGSTSAKTMNRSLFFLSGMFLREILARSRVRLSPRSKHDVGSCGQVDQGARFRKPFFFLAQSEKKTTKVKGKVTQHLQLASPCGQPRVPPPPPDAGLPPYVRCKPWPCASGRCRR